MNCLEKMLYISNCNISEDWFDLGMRVDDPVYRKRSKKWLGCTNCKEIELQVHRSQWWRWGSRWWTRSLWWSDMMKWVWGCWFIPPQPPTNFKLKLDINFTRPSDRLDYARVTSVKALSARVIGFSGKWADGDDDGDVVESLNFDREGEFDDKVWNTLRVMGDFDSRVIKTVCRR